MAKCRNGYGWVWECMTLIWSVNDSYRWGWAILKNARQSGTEWSSKGTIKSEASLNLHNQCNLIYTSVFVQARCHSDPMCAHHDCYYWSKGWFLQHNNVLLLIFSITPKNLSWAGCFSSGIPVFVFADFWDMSLYSVLSFLCFPVCCLLSLVWQFKQSHCFNTLDRTTHHCNLVCTVAGIPLTPFTA